MAPFRKPVARIFDSDRLPVTATEVDTQIGCVIATSAFQEGFTNMVSLPRLCRRSFLGVSTFLLMGGLAQATTVDFATLTLGAGNPTQLGRLSRNGVPSDWSVAKAFPGTINTGTPYHYTTLDLNLAALESGFEYGGFIQIDFDSPSLNTFLSAYLNSYNPSNEAANYAGDAGLSGNSFGNPGFFQVFVPSGNDLVLVLNETTSNGGLAQPGNVTVEAFADSQFTDLIATPEPGTLSLLASGIALLARRRLRRGTAA